MARKSKMEDCLMNNFTKELKEWTKELIKNIEHEKTKRMMQSSCKHHWLSDQYMVKHCQKCRKIANE